MVFDVGDNAADLMRMMELHFIHFRPVFRLEGIYLRQESHNRVVEDAANDCSAFKEPI